VELYPTAAAIGNALVQITPTPATWSLGQRLAIVRRGNANYRTGTYSRRRSRTEHQLQRWLVTVPRLVGQLRAVAENHRDRAELIAVADALELVTPAQLGAIEDRRPRAGSSPHRTRYFVPDAALAHVRAYVRLAKWASRFLAIALGGVGRALRGLLKLARPVAPRHARLPQEVPPPDPIARPEITTGAVVGTWEAVAERIRRRIEADVGDAPPPSTT
jgi:hypothetical protein